MDRLFPVQQEQLTSDDYYTPRWLFDRMGIRFDLDVCAPPGGVEWVPADRYYDQAADGLAQPWHGRVWMNPPFSRIGAAGQPATTRQSGLRSSIAAWVKRFLEHRHGVALVPSTRSRWCLSLWQKADGIVLAPSFPFIYRGEPTYIYMPVFLAAFGGECVDAIARLGIVRKVA